MTDILSVYRQARYSLVSACAGHSPDYKRAQQALTDYLLQTEASTEYIVGLHPSIIRTICLHNWLFKEHVGPDQLLDALVLRLARLDDVPGGMLTYLRVSQNVTPDFRLAAQTCHLLQRTIDNLAGYPEGEEQASNSFTLTLYQIAQLPDLEEFVPIYQPQCWLALQGLFDYCRYTGINKHKTVQYFRQGLQGIQNDPRLTASDVLYWCRCLAFFNLLILGYADIRSATLGTHCLALLLEFFSQSLEMPNV